MARSISIPSTDLPSQPASMMTRSRRDKGTPGNAVRKKPRGDEKEAVLEVDRGEASGDVASVTVEGEGVVPSFRSMTPLLSELPSTCVPGGDDDKASLMSCSSWSAPVASSARIRRSLRSLRFVSVSGSRSDTNAAMSELSKEGNSSWRSTEVREPGGRKQVSLCLFLPQNK